ncbi:hypothetical protein TeGR_g957 [Tetraparma gracilis]|uniref:UTP-monosaccharide-1-phosphate uridylyltransferase n=1 Tax=Tetraparma gracilis TaxID=2962635 RepID=A0ABQ6MNW5_9STRA|nr:hypothetical protein TeGR_g957 [Tetraparma gracilis]
MSSLDAAYPGGLPSYVSKARSLLAASLSGANPFAGYTPSVPPGESLAYASPAHLSLESSGLSSAGGLGFVLVAGGLGERLGYPGVKVGLSPYAATGETYLGQYASFLLALGARTGRVPPLCIMTSEDTDAGVRKLLAKRGDFGLPRVDVVTQQKVAALADAGGGLAFAVGGGGEVEIVTKPHGHGDVHSLLHRSGLLPEYAAAGVTHLAFLQDTNALATNGVLPALGVAVGGKQEMTSICVPRVAGEAAGAIAELGRGGGSVTINVEYNQLGPLLRAGGGDDVADPGTGYSPFPGNTNNFILELSSYAATLAGPDEGVVSEFVNPKMEADGVTFKKPARLECMMQDYPWLLQKRGPAAGGPGGKVGFASLPRWLSFSPAKNSLQSGQEAEAAGGAGAGTLASAESEGYYAGARKLMAAGVELEEPRLGSKVAGITIYDGPRVVLSPSFALTHGELVDKFTSSAISSDSWLTVEGANVRISNLKLAGALVVKCLSEKATLTVDGLVCENLGWRYRELTAGEMGGGAEGVTVEDRTRGYVLERLETMEIVVGEDEVGNFRVGVDGRLLKEDGEDEEGGGVCN